MKGERLVGGLTCSQVLARLSDYLDGDLDPAAREPLETHVRGCDHCTRFGGVFATVVGALRERLTERPLPRDARQRLLDAL